MKNFLLSILVKYETGTKRDRNGRNIKHKVCRKDSCMISCSSNNNQIGFNNVAYAEVNVIMGFEMMTSRNKPLIELMYGCKIDSKNKVLMFSIIEIPKNFRVPLLLKLEVKSGQRLSLYLEVSCIFTLSS